MFDFDVGVIAEQRYMSRYEVFCNRCSESIGTLEFSAIREAIFNTLGRGGILCPGCRKSTCDGCGLLCAEGFLEVVDGPKGPLRLCDICGASFAKLGIEITKAIVLGEEVKINWEDVLPY